MKKRKPKPKEMRKQDQKQLRSSLNNINMNHQFLEMEGD
jgi:hypothetical protein